MIAQLPIPTGRTQTQPAPGRFIRPERKFISYPVNSDPTRPSGIKMQFPPLGEMVRVREDSIIRSPPEPASSGRFFRP
jgi:hypothetical protein